MTNSRDVWLHSIQGKQVHVGIIGLGYVGLPLARTFALSGFRVLGFDTDLRKVEQLQRGESYIGHIPSALIRQMQTQGFEASSRLERLSEPDAILICVPTPLTEAREPDLRFVIAASDAISSWLGRGKLIVLESTTYPGTTREVVLPILEKSGLRTGQDFFLAYSPEREDPGNPDFATPSIPKVVGGINAASLELAATLYEQVVTQVVRVSSCEVAEASKLLENTYRAVNIALVNELKVLYDRMGIDVWEVIEAAKTKPFGFQVFYPGPGLGGHCIPIDPFYLAWLARKHGLESRFIELAGEVNTTMPRYVFDKAAKTLKDRGKLLRGSRVLVLGVAYKKDVDDTRESPGLELLDLLCREGAEGRYNDPHVPRLPTTRRHPHLRLESQSLTEDFLRAQDAVLIVTDHSAYDWTWIVKNSALVIDTRDATRGVLELRDRIVKA
jgi:UDP-N-acetyl-D-glucosamine dehydrogenase